MVPPFYFTLTNMKNYYYINSVGKQVGPITIEEFSKIEITNETKVWSEGMTEWTNAGNIPDFKPYITGTTQVPPTPPIPPIPPTQIEKCPNNYLAFAILSTLLCCLPIGIAAIIYSTKVDNAWSQGDKEAALKNSETTKLLCLISFGCGILIFIISFFIGFLSAL